MESILKSINFSLTVGIVCVGGRAPVVEDFRRQYIDPIHRLIVSWQVCGLPTMAVDISLLKGGSN